MVNNILELGNLLHWVMQNLKWSLAQNDDGGEGGDEIWLWSHLMAG